MTKDKSVPQQSTKPNACVCKSTKALGSARRCQTIASCQLPLCQPNKRSSENIRTPFTHQCTSPNNFTQPEEKSFTPQQQEQQLASLPTLCMDHWIDGCPVQHTKEQWTGPPKGVDLPHGTATHRRCGASMGCIYSLGALCQPTPIGLALQSP